MKSAIKIENLCVHYGELEALHNINLEIEQGEYLGIIGPNGSGKTTLLKSVLGLIPITAGEIQIMGGPISKNRTKIGYVPQLSHANRKFPITVLDVVTSGRINNKITPFYKHKKTDYEIAEKELAFVGLKDFGRRSIDELSGGQFQKVLLARALAMDPDILILDEPTANVDAKSSSDIYELLHEFNRDKTVILVTHDTMAISSNVKTLACLNQTLVYHGEPRLTEDTISNMYGCPIDLIAHGVPHRVYGRQAKGGES